VDSFLRLNKVLDSLALLAFAVHTILTCFTVP
jgi:hypothetical protein